MREIIKITDFSAPELDLYVRLTGAELRSRVEGEAGVFIAESPTVVEVALGAGCEPISVLTDEKLLRSEQVVRILAKTGDAPVYVAESETLKGLTGFALTRGVLSAMRRPTLPTVEEICRDARRIAVLEGITDSTNIGAVFRSAAALNVDAVLCTPTCCDPLCRRAVRVSMGTVLQVPFTRIGEKKEDWPHPGIERLRALGFKTCAMALCDKTIPIDDPRLAGEEKLAIVLGTEGDGLARMTIADCDYAVKIPMAHGVDSLNVAAAGAVAFWELCDH